MSWTLIPAALIALLIVGGVLAVIGGSFLVSRYNSLVQVQENVDQAWANVEVMLKQRSDELPKIIDVARRYLEHEQEVLTEVTEARTAAEQAQGPRAEAEADGQLRGALGRLFAVSEDYPELRSNEQFQQLQSRVSALEERIADRREFYNESTTIYNARIRQFPDVFFARAMHLEERELFEAAEEDLRDVDVGARLNVDGEEPAARRDGEAVEPRPTSE